MEPIGLDIVRSILDDYADRAREQARGSALLLEHWAAARPPSLHERMADAGVAPCTWVP